MLAADSSSALITMGRVVYAAAAASGAGYLWHEFGDVSLFLT